MQYLVKFLDEVGWVLSTEKLQRVHTIRQPRVMGKTAVALKRFIDTVVKVRDQQIAPLLYDAFKTVQSRQKNNFHIPTLKEVKKVWEEAHKT